MRPPIVRPGSKSPRPACRDGQSNPRRFRPRLVRLESRVLLAGADPSPVGPLALGAGRTPVAEVGRGGDGRDAPDSSPAPPPVADAAVDAPGVPKTQAVIATSTSLSVAPAPSRFGDPVTLTATVRLADSDQRVATGSVTFLLANHVIGTAAVDSEGVATLANFDGIPGDPITKVEAAYGADGPFAASVGETAAEAAASVSTLVTLSSTDPAPALGAPVTYLSTVVTATPAGQPIQPLNSEVRFYDGTTLIGTATVAPLSDEYGLATLTVVPPAGGTHLITARADYPEGQGAGTVSTATSRTITETIPQLPTHTALTVTPAAPVAGRPWTLSASIASTPGSRGPIAGTVDFRVDGALIGTASVANGRAVLPATAPAGGHQDITATYSGAGDNAPSVASLGVETIAATALSLNLPTQVPYGQAVQVTAKLTAADGPALPLPAQAVTITVAGQPVTPSSITGGTVTATLPILAPGSYPIEASFVGDANFAASGAVPATLTVVKAVTSLRLDPAAGVAYGDPATIQATVANTSSAATPVGVVRFFVAGSPPQDVTLFDGVATLPLAKPAAGDHSVTAEYLGNDDFRASGPTAPATPFTIAPAPTTTEVSFDPAAPIYLGEDRAIEVTVSPTNKALETPTGPVDLVEAGAVIASAAVDAGGQVRFSTATLRPGQHDVTVVYEGAGNFAASQAPTALAFTVVPATVALDPIPSHLTYGQPVTLHATVTNHSTAGGMGGSVTFFVNDKPYAPDAPGGTTLSLGVLPAGDYAITAEFAADGADFGPSVSPSMTLSMAKASASLTLITPVETSYGQMLTLAANVATGSGQPTGQVTFVVDGVAQYEGTLAGGAATISVGGLAAGTHQVTARYDGDGNFLAVEPTAPAAVFVAQAPTSVTLDRVAPTPFGRGIALTARVTSGTDSPPAGEVQFLIDGVVRGTGLVVGGASSVTVTGLTAGTYSATARYLGTADDLGAASPAAVAVVRLATTTTRLMASQTTIAAGQTIALTATVKPQAASSAAVGGTVTFDLDDQPIATVGLAAGGVATLPALTLAPGNHLISATYNGQPGRFDVSDASTGPAPTISLLGGTGVAGFAGDGGPAIAAEFDAPAGLAVDARGQLLIADSADNRIRLISNPTGPDPIVTTIAGAGQVGGFASDLATLNDPTAIATDAAGDMFVADTGDGRVLVLDPTTGQVAVLLGSGAANPTARVPLDRPQGLAVNAAGTMLYVADTGNNRIIQVALLGSTGLPTAGQVAPLAATILRPSGVANDVHIPGLAAPTGLALDPSGDLIIADTGNNLVRRYAPASGVLTVVAGNPAKTPGPRRGLAIGTTFAAPDAVVVAGNGEIFVLCGGDNTIHNIGTDGDTTTVATLPGGGTTFDGAQGLAIEAGGTLFGANTDANILQTVSFAEADLDGSDAGVEIEVGAAAGSAAAGLQVSAQLVPLAGASVALVGTIVVSVASGAGDQAEITATGAPNQTTAPLVGQTLLDEAGGDDAAGDPGDAAPGSTAPDREPANRPIDAGVLDALLDSTQAAEDAHRQAFGRPEPAPAPPPARSPERLRPSGGGDGEVDPGAADLIIGSVDWAPWRPAVLGGMATPDDLGFPAVAVLAASALVPHRLPQPTRRALPRPRTR